MSKNQQDIFSDKDIKALYSFAHKCLQIRQVSLLDTNILTPTNFHKEKEKFLKSKTYNPQFTYKKALRRKTAKEIQQLQQYVTTMKLPNDLESYFLEYLDNLSLLSQTVQSIGSDTFPHLTNKLFKISVNNAHEVAQALPKISFHEEYKPTMHSAEEIATIFRNYLHTYKELYNYRILLDTFNDHTIRVGEKQLVIGTRVKRTTNNVKRLIVHEKIG